MSDNLPIIAPSILSSDFGNLQREIEMINGSEADWIHVDVMDGEFVPNISFGIPVCKAIARYAEKPLDVHLMIIRPERYVESFSKAGASLITVHAEACTHLHRVVQLIKGANCKVGVALNPHTPVEALTDIIDQLDMVLIMSVNPGFGGQQFIRNSFDKIKRLRAIIQQRGSSTLIEVDGGVNDQNATELVQAGADVLVAGNHIFQSKSPKETISLLKNATARTV